MNKNIFIVHGHDSLSLLELKEFVRKLGLTPIVLTDQPNAGLTIIEKFEKYAKKCSFAMVLLTPDDKQAKDLEESEKYRARQNVILEMGWFMSRLGRSKVVLLHKGKVELPSDIVGVLYLNFNTSVSEVYEKIRDELIVKGLIQ